MKLHRSIPAAAILAIALLSAGASAQFTNVSVTNELKIESGTPVVAGDVTKLLSNGCFYSIKARPAGDAPILTLETYTTESTVFFWEAGRTALRAGLFSGIGLSPWNMGVASTAFGYHTEAYGLALAGGASSKAHGYGSLAYGQNAHTTGPWSLAVGDSAMALNWDSVALGLGVTADGVASVALNACTNAFGAYSFAAGLETRADAYAAFVIGRYNTGGFTGPTGGTAWNAQDPLFEIGIGDEPSADNGWQPARSNALTVYKDGRVIIHKVQGDISMGDFQ